MKLRSSTLRSRSENIEAPGSGRVGLLHLPESVLGSLWPAQRVVLGRRVCKLLHEQLKSHSRDIVLARKSGAKVNLDQRLVDDVRRLQTNLVTLKWGKEKLCNAFFQIVRGITPGLRHLQVNAKNFVDKAQQMAEVLGACTQLEHLDLRGSFIQDEGAQSLASVLGKLKMLSHLDLRHDELYPETNRGQFKAYWIGEKGGVMLSKALAQCESLTFVDLGGNAIQDNGATALVESLRKCKKLQHLGLANTLLTLTNSFACSGKRLASAIGAFKELSELDLHWNYIDNQGVTHLVEALAGCRQLRLVDLQINDIGYEGAAMLVAALEGLGTPITLDLSWQYDRLFLNRIPTRSGGALRRQAGGARRLDCGVEILCAPYDRKWSE